MWLCAAAAAITWLSFSLPPDGFFSGDAGLKLVAALNARAHPDRPFDLDLPTVEGHRMTTVDPMVVVHGDHAHPVQSPVFPVLSAPLVALLGLRGVYLLPALSFVVMVPLLEALRRSAMPSGSPALLGAFVVLANPLLFYALEFWEHAPAVALLCAATLLVFRARGRPAMSTHRALAGAGACAGAAMLLRPEAAWYAGALVLCLPPRTWTPVLAGIAIVLAPFGVASYVHSGNPFGTHIATALAPLGHAWLAARWERIDAWIWPGSAPLAIGLLLIAVAWVLRAFRVPDPVTTSIGLAGAAAIAVMAADQWFDRGSLWRAFPLAALACIPSEGAGTDGCEKPLWLLVWVSAAGIVLTATHDGGAQWGPRFLLVVTPPVMLLALRRATFAIRPGGLRLARVAALVVVVAACAATSRAAFRELRGAKVSYARLVHATRDFTTRNAPVVTNVWWLDQTAGSLYGTRTILYAATPPEVSQILRRVGGFDPRPDVTLVWTEEPDGAALDHAVDGTCYEIRAVRRIPERKLVFASAACLHDLPRTAILQPHN